MVYTNNFQTIQSQIGWQEFTLNTPFVWNGTDNLEILVDWYQPTGTTAQIYWQHSFVVGMAGKEVAINTAPANLQRSGARPNIQLEFGSNTVTDAGITAITAPVSPVLPGVSLPVQATLRNFGGTALTAATINWSVNGVPQTPYSWSGNVSPATSTAPVTIGNFAFPAGSHSVCVWSQSPNGATDANPQNDSSCVTLASCLPLAGNYTINSAAPASATNFQSFAAAAKRLTDCGVTGAVKFTVAPGSGPYAETFALTTIPGNATADSIVFDGGNVTLTANTTSAQPAAILVNGTKKVTFRNLNLHVNSSAAIYNAGFQFMNAADSCTVANCTITLATPDGIGILGGSDETAAGNFTSYSTFRNNTITGAHTAIRLNGDMTTPATGNRILNNQVRDFRFNGIYLHRAQGALIEGNEISRPTQTGGLGYKGIYLYQSYGQNVINANRLHQTHAANFQSQAYGIHLENTDAPVGAENLITNNLLYNFNNTGDKVALYNFRSTGAHYFHNTIFLENMQPASGHTRGFYQDLPATNIKFINNIIGLGMAGGYKHHALYFNDLTSGIESHHNVLYLNPTATATMFTGYTNTTDFTTLTQWQATTYDQNSNALDPAFANVTAGNLKPTANALKNTGAPLAAVTKDFAGTPRSSTNPDPGAFEFSNPLGLKENGIGSFAVKAFPNPFSRELTLQLNAAKAGELKFTLSDALGRTVLKNAKKVPNGTQMVSLNLEAGLPAGFYVLQLELNGLIMQQKLIKQ